MCQHLCRLFAKLKRWSHLNWNFKLTSANMTVLASLNILFNWFTDLVKKDHISKMSVRKYLSESYIFSHVSTKVRESGGKIKKLQWTISDLLFMVRDKYCNSILWFKHANTRDISTGDFWTNNKMYAVLLNGWRIPCEEFYIKSPLNIYYCLAIWRAHFYWKYFVNS